MIPLATTTVIVQRRTDTAEPYEAETWADLATVAGHLSNPTGTEQTRGGSQEVVDAVLLADTVDLRHTDRIIDTTGTYEVLWVQPRQGLGLDHVKAGLRRIRGVTG